MWELTDTPDLRKGRERMRVMRLENGYEASTCCLGAYWRVRAPYKWYVFSDCVLVCRKGRDDAYHKKARAAYYRPATPSSRVRSHLPHTAGPVAAARPARGPHARGRHRRSGPLLVCGRASLPEVAPRREPAPRLG